MFCIRNTSTLKPKCRLTKFSLLVKKDTLNRSFMFVLLFLNLPRHLGNMTAKTPVKFQADMIISTQSRDFHDDVIKWKHFPRYWPFVREIHRSPVNFPHKGQWRGALMFALICVWLNGWVNNREAGGLRRYRAHCDVIVMLRGFVRFYDKAHYWMYANFHAGSRYLRFA